MVIRNKKYPTHSRDVVKTSAYDFDKFLLLVRMEVHAFIKSGQENVLVNRQTKVYFLVPDLMGSYISNRKQRKETKSCRLSRFGINYLIFSV